MRGNKQAHSCDACGDELEHLFYQCNYCGDGFCPAHRIPEKHGCVGLALTLSLEDKWFIQNKDDERSVVTAGATDRSQVDETVRHLEQKSNAVSRTEEERREKISRLNRILSDEPTAGTPKKPEFLGEPPSERSGKPYRVFEPELTVGTSIEPTYSKSPDLNPDGTLQYEDEPDYLAEDAITLDRRNSSILKWTLLSVGVLGLLVVVAVWTGLV